MRLGRKGKPNGKLHARWYILFAVIAGFAALLIAQGAPQVSNTFDPVRSAASDRLAGGKRNSVLAFFSRADEKDQQIKELQTEIRELTQYKHAYISMTDRMKAYERILNMVGEPPENGVTARVTAETDGPFKRTLLANAGSNVGVQNGSVALNESGVVGRVITLGKRSSRILRVSDFNSRVPVLGELSGVRAILYGGRDGIGNLRDLPEKTDFVEGERILTSSEGGAFPRGLTVGTAFVSNDGDWRVKFASTGREGGYVQLLPPPAIPKPVIVEEAEPVPTSASQGAR